MSAVTSKTLCIALVGNPNTGKSTLFQALSGVHQRVGNYPGVTVEKKIGHLVHDHCRWALIDLPGTYSLAPRSLDEMVTVDVLLGRRDDVEHVDAVLCIVDATNLERNLYLVSQVLELERPTVVALNMIDVARQRGIEIDVPRLQAKLGVRVVPVQANRRIGLKELKHALAAAADEAAHESPSPFPELFQREVANLSTTFAANRNGNRPMPRYLVERLLLDVSGYLESASLVRSHAFDARRELADARSRLAAAGMPVPAVEAVARYSWAASVLEGVVKRPAERRATLTDRIDRVLTHRLWGTLGFLLMMFIVFQAVFHGAAPLMDMIDSLFASVGEAVGNAMPEGALRSLVVDGVIGGVGGVVIFLPQILILFFFIAVLEDCGYMARIAYLMDRLMARAGLSGKSFIPLLSSFACAIPGIMATRVIEDRRDRFTTILVAPLMSCSARLPVYTLLIAAFVPQTAWLGGLVGVQGLVMMAMYLLGIVTAIVVALVLKRTVLRGPTPPFVMELPSYKWPSLRTVVYRMAERGWMFVQRAGTLIVAVSIVVWAALYYPHDSQRIDDLFAPQIAAMAEQRSAIEHLPDDAPERIKVAEAQRELDNEIVGEYRRNSYLGRAGHAIEPVVRPLGWDWRIGCAAIASFPAREVIVATLGIIYNLGEEVDTENEEDRGHLVAALQNARWTDTGERVFNLPVALSIMVFFALCAQCASTLVIIKRETNSWAWPTFTFVYMTTLAYLGALVTYQVGRLFL
ncbi:MAG TPA: ferrous iron transport protein B [Pirellulales bacterium]|nr:ferrous iron transport protein B [Pirellulales bacterium]